MKNTQPFVTSLYVYILPALIGRHFDTTPMLYFLGYSKSTLHTAKKVPLCFHTAKNSVWTNSVAYSSSYTVCILSCMQTA